MSQYDLRTTTFSQEGRLFQVEYALEAINNASATVGIQTPEGIVLAADRMVSSKLLDPESEKEKLYIVDDRVICAVAGWTADANVLLNQGRLVSQRHLYRYDEHIPIDTLVNYMCDLKQSYTQFGGLRPYGVSFLIAGWDETKGFQLFHTDPAGNFSGWKATAVGQNSVTAQSILKQEWQPTMTLDEGLLLAARILIQTNDSAAPTADCSEFAVLKLKEGTTSAPKGGVVHKYLSQADVDSLLKRAASSAKIVVKDD